MSSGLTATLLLIPGINWDGEEGAGTGGGSGPATSTSVPAGSSAQNIPGSQGNAGPQGGVGPGVSGSGPTRAPRPTTGSGGGSTAGGLADDGPDPDRGSTSQPFGGQVVTSEFTIEPGEGWDTVAACPAGQAPVGGGYFHGSDPGVLVDISRPATNQSGWHVHATNFSSQTHPITAYAVCAVIAGQQVVTSEFTIDPGNGWDTVAGCPAGKTPTGGGFFFGSDPGVLLDISRPTANRSGWHVHATNYSGQTHTITAYAVCVNA